MGFSSSVISSLIFVSFCDSKLFLRSIEKLLQMLIIESPEKKKITFLRKMIRGGFRRKPDNQDGTQNFGYVYTNDAVYTICNATPLSTFSRHSQTKYLAHIVRQPDSSISKCLLFNSNKYTKRGKPSPSLLSQVLKYHNLSSSEFFAKSHKRCY